MIDPVSPSGASLGGASRGEVLLDVARRALERAFGIASSEPAPDLDWLMAPGATFVSLYAEGTLRGCVGSLEACRPLATDVEANACAAAFADPRFTDLEAVELPRLTIEVSELSTPEPVPGGDESTITSALVPGRDGVIFRWRERSSTFLPQVWRQLPERDAFVAGLKEKAGLPADFWDPDCRLARYRVTVWRSG